MQRWPAAPNAEPRIPSTVLSMTASGMTTMWFLAPPSACTRLPAWPRPRRPAAPPARSPTNETASMPGWSRMPSTISRPPLTRLTTPGGQAQRVELLEGDLLGQRHLLRRLEHERVAAGDGEGQEPERDHRREVEGHDRRAHARPAGGWSRRRCCARRPPGSGPASSWGSRTPPPPSRSSAPPRRVASAIVLPISVVTARAISSWRATRRSRRSNSLRARAIVDTARHSGSAARAAATAASRSARTRQRHPRQRLAGRRVGDVQHLGGGLRRGPAPGDVVVQ